jgi:cytochrome P450
MPTESAEVATQCPVLPFRFAGPSAEALHYFQEMDGLRATAPVMFRSDDAQGYWVVTDPGAILEGLQNPSLFSSAAMVPMEPDPPYKWIPIMLDPPEHTKWRQLLSSWFSPGRVKRMEPEQRQFAAELIDAIAMTGRTDFVADIAQIFPTTIFLRIMGMPLEDLPQFMEWERAILHGDDSEASTQLRFDTMMQVSGYFMQLIAERRATGTTGEQEDLVSSAISWQIDGEQIDDASLLSCFILLFMAGLDTVASQVSYALYDLATHPDTRSRIVADPSTVPAYVEEVLRVYPIVQTARKVTTDTTFHGCPMKAGDMALFPLNAVGRDERQYPQSTKTDVDRGPTRHLAFGAGQHRCLGSHLARQELAILLDEWHKRIPDYELAGKPTEHAGGVFGLNNLPLRWDGKA